MQEKPGLDAEETHSGDCAHPSDRVDQTTGRTRQMGDDDVLGSVQAFLDAFAALDWEPFRRCFADDATVFFPIVDHPQRAEGREQIERLFGGVFERARAVATAGPPFLALQPHDLYIRHMGESALVTFHLHDPGVLCRRTLILQRQTGGWKIVHLHASNLPASAEQDPPKTDD